MEIIIKTKNLELTPSLQQFVEEKIGSLKKFLDVFKKEEEQGKTLSEIFVEVKKDTMHHRKGDVFGAEAKIYLPGKSLIAEATGDNLENAITELKDELQQEIKKYKVKKTDIAIRKQRKNKDVNF